MFFTLTRLFYKITILLFFSVFFSVSGASEAGSKKDTKKSCGITPTNISKKTKQISGIKVQCQKDYERVLSYCTEKGLAAIQAISMGGQTVANALNILKSKGNPDSAKKTMGVSKKLSYGLSTLNTGIGVKCIANIKSCSNSCGRAEKTKECLETVIETAEQASTVSPSARVLYSQAISSAEKFITKLDKVDGHSLKCKRFKSNAYAALAQGALHGATGLIQSKMEKNMGTKTDTDTSDSDNNDSEAFNLPEPSAPSGEPTVGINDTPDNTSSDTSSGQFAGNQLNSNNETGSDGDLNDDIDDGFRDIASNPDSTGGDFGGETYGGSSGSSYSGGSNGNIPFNTAEASDDSVEEGTEGEWNEDSGYEGEASFSGSGFSRGGNGGGGYYDGDSSGYHEPYENRDGGDGLTEEDLEEEKNNEEMEQLKKSIGGKHESIFEKASKVLINYCMEGPLKCE